jgi:dienelactone hydrolase
MGNPVIQTNAISMEAINIRVPLDYSKPEAYGELCGHIYRSRNTPPKPPCIILLHGFGGSYNDLAHNQIGCALALAGYAFLGFNQRTSSKATVGDFKQNGMREVLNAYQDIETVIDYVINRPDIDGTRIGVIGFSFGGGVALGYPVKDPRVKAIVACCSACGFSQLFQKAKRAPLISIQRLFYFLVKKKIQYVDKDLETYATELSVASFVDSSVDYSKKVFLSHCADDAIVPIENFEKNTQTFRLPPENLLRFEYGNHPFNGMQVPLLTQVLNWLNKALK